MSEEIVLHVKGLKKAFGAVIAADDLDVQVPPACR